MGDLTSGTGPGAEPWIPAQASLARLKSAVQECEGCDLFAEATQAVMGARASVYCTNAVKHFSFERRGRRRIHESPTRWQIAACGPWLVAELELVRPTGVVVLGVTAGTAVTGRAFRLKDHRGEFMGWPDDGPRLERPPAWWTATTHPSAVLRSRDRDEAMRGLVRDLERVREKLERDP